MTRLFTDGVYWGLVLSTETFARPDEPPAKAIARFMTNRKRQLRNEPRTFPKFTPGMTTRSYVQLYYLQNRVGGRDDINAPNRAAPVLVGPEAQEDTE